MAESYRNGYRKCLVDMVNMLQKFAVDLRSTKQARRFIESLMMLLLTNTDLFDEWMTHGADIRWLEDKLIVEKDGSVKVKE